MAIDFHLRDFFHPVDIACTRHFLERSQWWPREALEAYQSKRLRRIVEHAAVKVPYYQRLFSRLKLDVRSFTSLADLHRLPILTKETLRREGEDLRSRAVDRSRLYAHTTSGTSGAPVTLYRDAAANVLEFCYYWRYWSWSGYRLGTRFADFSLRPFLDGRLDGLASFSPFTGRLTVNPSQLGPQSLPRLVTALRRHSVKFLKGTPSTLHAFAALCQQIGEDSLRMKAVFTAGELLTATQRRVIEAIFRCRIVDSYGQMEQVAAASQCPEGSYHVHAEYGIFEAIPQPGGHFGIVGSGLHNLAMPLLRYDTGDTVELLAADAVCACGRGLPVIGRIDGRQQDALRTEDGRMVTNLFVMLEDLAAIDWFQIVQEPAGQVRVRLVARPEFVRDDGVLLKNRLDRVLGPGTPVEFEYLSQADVRPGEKHRSVIRRQAGQ